MAHKLVSITTTALVLALTLTLPGTAGAASLQPKRATASQPSWSWLTQLPWLGSLLAPILPGDSWSRSIATQEGTADATGTTSAPNACQPTLFPITSEPNQGSACDPNG